MITYTCPICAGQMDEQSRNEWLEDTDPRLVDAVTERFPSWKPADGMCSGCSLNYQEWLELMPDEDED